MDSSSQPKRIGSYDVVGVIGRGGMGTVYKATDSRIGRAVAIKVLTVAAEDPDLLLLRFYREAKYTGNLQHQNIVTVHELGYQDNSPYLVMEYLEGVSLAAIIAERRAMPVAEKLRIILQVCEGLAYAHKRDLVHRDMKPANIVIVENNTAKIVDFGIASVGGKRLTETGRIIGSLCYMSPEQLNGNVELDARTDIYSTGVVLFELLTGVLPFDGGTPAATLTKIMQEAPPSLKKYMKDCPPELEAITQKALAKDREERYASAEDLALDIAGVQRQYEKLMLTDCLHQANELLERKDFSSARQQLLQVLRIAPQNAEAGDLLRSLKQRQEKEQRGQQSSQLQAKAEEAFRRNAFEDALQYIEQGLQFDPRASALLRLREAIGTAQEKNVRYREALQRAESALQAGEFDNARTSVERALEFFPDDPRARQVAGQIKSRMEQRAKEQETARRERQLALDTSLVEKALAEARGRLSSGQVSAALQLLEEIQGRIPQLPAKWGEQVELLKKEARALQARAAKEDEERKQRAQQVSLLQAKAEEAFRRNALDDALQYIAQGLQFDPNAAALVRLQDAVTTAQKRVARYHEALQRAEFALQSADLENAKLWVDRALEIFPDDAQGKRVAAQVQSRTAQRLHDQEDAARRERQLALDTGLVERAIQNARVSLSLGQSDEALQLLQGIEDRISQLPPNWGQQVESLKEEAWAQKNRPAEATVPGHSAPDDSWKTQTSFGPASNANPQFAPVPSLPPPLRSYDQKQNTGSMRGGMVPLPPELPRAADPPTYRRQDAPPMSLGRPSHLPPQIAPQLSQPPAKPWARSTVWLGIAIVLLAAALLYLILRPHPAVSGPNSSSPNIPVASYTYAEINAEPWAIVKAIEPASSEAENAIGKETPLRITLPAGEYSVTLEGPRHERKQSTITVPQEGGTKCFVLFAKPDLNQLLGRP